MIEFVSPYFFRTEKSKYSMVIANLNFVFPAGVCSVCIRPLVVLITTPIYEPFRRPELKEGALGSGAPGRDSTQIRLVLLSFLVTSDLDAPFFKLPCTDYNRIF